MPTHMHIETDFFEEDYNNPSETYQRSQSVLFNHQKSAIIIENALESSRLRRLIWAFRVISRDPAEYRSKRKYSSGSAFASVKSQRRGHRQYTDSGNIESNLHGFESRSQSRVLTRKKSQSFHNIRSEAKQSRKAILEGIKHKLQDHSQNKSKVHLSRIIQKSEVKKQSEETQHLDRRIRKLENLMRNIRRDKELNEPSIIHEKKIVDKMPKKETHHHQNYKIFIEEIQKLREQVSELKQLNETLVKSSRSKSERSHITSPKSSSIYNNEIKKNITTSSGIHTANYEFKHYEKNQFDVLQENNTKRSLISQKQKVSTPKHSPQNSQHYSHKRQDSQQKNSKTDAYKSLINSIRSPKVPTGQSIQYHNHHKDFPTQHQKKQEIHSHIDFKHNQQKQHVNNQKGQVSEEKKQKFGLQKQEKYDWEKYQVRINQLVGLNNQQEKYSPLTYGFRDKKEPNYEKNFEKNLNTTVNNGYKGNYTPDNAGYTNPQLFKKLGSNIQSDTTLKSFQMIKNTVSQPYPEYNEKSGVRMEEKNQERKSIQDDLHTYRSSSFVYSQQTLGEIPENTMKKQIKQQTQLKPDSQRQRTNIIQEDYHFIPLMNNQMMYSQLSQPQNYTRSHSTSSVPFAYSASSSMSNFQINRPNNIQYMQQQPNLHQAYQRPGNLSIPKQNLYQKPHITFNGPISRY